MKGISPLVAAVLLIAVTMTIAGMLAYWASSFVRMQTAAFENQSVTGVCNYADFRIYQCTYNSTTSKVNIILENLRSVQLTDIKLNVFYLNGSVSVVNLNESLDSGMVQAYYVTGIANFTKVLVKTQCPELSKESSCK